MPVYKARYFGEALDSVLAQTYPSLELLICDDSDDGRIQAIIESRRTGSVMPIRYHRNPDRLGEHRSTAKAIGLAQGKYIKFLHDDDVLEPDCVLRLVAAMEDEPTAAMASSRRVRIDEDGHPLPDILATALPFAGDMLIDGPQLVSFLAEHTINFIGEPSCVLCRREDLLPIADELMMLNGRVIHWVGDLALYAKLLRRGNLAMLAAPLTRFRVSNDQFSQAGRDQPGIGDQGHADFRQAIGDLGWVRHEGDNQLVDVAPMAEREARVFRPLNLIAALASAAGLGGVPPDLWLAARRPDAAQAELMRQHLLAHAGGPRIAIVCIARDSDGALVENTLAQLKALQLPLHLELIPLVPAADAPPAARIDAINRCIQDAGADWVMLVDGGSEFTSAGLLVLALQLIGLPASCKAVFADEVTRFERGAVVLSLRPDFNLDLLLSASSLYSRHWLFRRADLLARGGFSREAGGAFELDQQLRLVEQEGMAGIHHVGEPIVAADARLLPSADVHKALRRHLLTRGYDQAQVVDGVAAGVHEISYGHAWTTSVSVLILVDGRLAAVQRCLETLLANTSFVNYEVLLLDRGSGEPGLGHWLDGIEQMQSQQIRVLRLPRDIAEAAARNQGAQQARGEFLLWLSAGAGIVDKAWMQQLLNHGQRPEVATVGAKLLGGDGRVRQAGMLLGLGGPAGRAFEGSGLNDEGYLQRLAADQDYSALSHECLLIRRALFLEAGGFDEDPAIARWMDVDLCLKLRQAGYLNVLTPRARVLVDAPGKAAATAEEEDAMYRRWLPLLAGDPAYHVGFSLHAQGAFKLAEPALAWQPLKCWRPLPVVLAQPADQSGCGHYRVIQPLAAMRQALLLDGTTFAPHLSACEVERFDPDVIVLQRQVGEQRLESMRRMQAFSRAFKVYELDDYLPNLPLKSIHREQMPKDILRTIRRGLGYVDRFVVSTPALAEAFAGLHRDIRVIENRLPTHWWKDLAARALPAAGPRRPRIGWAGAASHTGDLELVADVVKELAGEVDWVFLGMCPASMRGHIRELHPGVPIDDYPAKLASLDLDLAIAPVEQNLFNDCKSNLRLLEYGACGYPVIASDVRCYQGTGLPVTLVKNRFRDWIGAIRDHLADRQAMHAAGAALRTTVHERWLLEGAALAQWRAAWLPD
ncbi:glycosyltransferase [Pseudoxanthomonas composti]|uniref:Glycosyltransferase n=1 Tax=Pseudoxanthomonas composti TaxID=2137479 RepID=A0A4Q1JUY3_9GAMM|nr:glycosyltransferase [Pseudoxanthomonas composti]RXR02787.1 glycosyltransferase [Pseudoxanthomonas composti]